MIDILYEDDHCIVVNKPPKLLTHPSRETAEKENLLFSVRDQIGLYLYPIHRLDRATSGIVILGKEKEFVKGIKEIWNTDQVQKFYLALVDDVELQSGEYDFPLKSEKGHYQEAKTTFKPILHFETCTFLELQIFTGRRHQIRRHFSRRMKHVIGDRRYGKKRVNNHYMDEYGLQRLFLHCHKFIFRHPISSEVIQVDCPLYNDLKLVLDNLKRR